MTQLQGWRNQVCTLDVQSSFWWRNQVCILDVLPAVLTLPTPVVVILPTPSLAFVKEKERLLYWQGPKKCPEYCLQSGEEVFYERTIRAENEDAP